MIVEGNRIIRKTNGFSVMEVNDFNDSLLEKIAKLYCEIWKEPPWNEDNWTIEGVKNDVLSQAKNYNSVFLIALKGEEVVGFTWGYEVGRDSASQMCGGDHFSRYFKNCQGIFYIDELGISAKCRIKGLGKLLSLICLERARKKGISVSFLRTSVNAGAARCLYKKIGFKDLSLPDPIYKDRTYWVKEDI